MSPVSAEWLDINAHLCEKGMEYISYLEEVGEEKAQIRYSSTLKEINEAHHALRANLKERGFHLQMPPPPVAPVKVPRRDD